ncbi:hypothetical protein JCM5353_004055 [Sporobolomyces roseus]
MQYYGGYDGFKTAVKHLKDPGLDKVPTLRTNQEYAELREVLFRLQFVVETTKGKSRIEQQLYLQTNHPFNTLVSILKTSPVPELVYTSAFHSWLTDFLHKYLIYFVFVALCMQEDNAQNRQYAAYTRSEFQRYVKEVVPATHPKEARLLLEWIGEGPE